MSWIKQPGNPGEPDMWWNSATNQYSSQAPSDVEQFIGRFAALRPAGYEDTSGFDNYLRSLAARGYTAQDFNAALDKAIQTNGWKTEDGQDAALANVTRLADQERIKLMGQAFDALGKDTGWNSLYNADAAAKQQGAVNERNERGQREYDASSGIDWGGIALGFGAVLGVGALTGAFGGAAAAGATAEAGATAAAAGDAGFLTAGGVTTPSTGGMFVGNSGLLGGTGNAIADAALNGAVRGGVTSALTGGDIGNGLISGGLSGGISSALPDLGSTALNNAAKGAVSGGVGAAVSGGDILTGAAAGGAAGGVGTLVRDAVGTEVGGNTLANAAAGGAAGAVGSAIAGGDVATGLIRGAVTGGASGAATDLGADPAIAGAAGTLAGSLINSPTPDAGTPPAQQQQTSNEITSGLGFSVVLPQFQNNPRRDMQWGTRLNGG